jgi:hypothetical protein
MNICLHQETYAFQVIFYIKSHLVLPGYGQNWPSGASGRQGNRPLENPVTKDILKKFQKILDSGAYLRYSNPEFNTFYINIF